MSSLRRGIIEAIESELRFHGVETWTMTHNKHLKFKFVFRGRALIFTCAGSPSDYRAHLNAVTDLRAVMGVKRAVRKNPANRQYRRAAPKRLPEAPGVTPGRDFWGALAGFVAAPWAGSLGMDDMGLEMAARDLADAIVGSL